MQFPYFQFQHLFVIELLKVNTVKEYMLHNILSISFTTTQTTGDMTKLLTCGLSVTAPNNRVNILNMICNHHT